MTQKTWQHALHGWKGNKDSIVDMEQIVPEMYRRGVGPEHDGVTRRDVAEIFDCSLEYRAKTSLSHLKDTPLVEQDPETFEELTTFVIATWRGEDGEIVNGEINEAATEAIEALIDHMHATDRETGNTSVATDGGGITHRSVLAETFDIHPSAIEQWLRGTNNKLSTLNTAVISLWKAGVATHSSYGPLGFRNQAYRYRLTEEALTLIESHKKSKQ